MKTHGTIIIYEISYPRAVVLNHGRGGNSAPQWTFGDGWRYFWLSQLGGMLLASAGALLCIIGCLPLLTKELPGVKCQWYEVKNAFLKG